MHSENDQIEGFHPQDLQIQQISRTKETLYRYAQTPAKQLEISSRPKVTTPRVYRSTVLMKKLPPEVIKARYPVLQTPLQTNFSQYEPYLPTKNKFNGNGKVLTQIFQKPLYTCIYDKNQNEQRLPDEPSSRKRRLGSPYDYNSKAFIQLVEHEHSKQPGTQFDSSFECGNLSQAYKSTQPNDYYLLLEDDTNTRGYNEWFFFSVSNLPTSTISFSIVNMNKKSSMYSRGFQISIWTENKGWHKAGENISYYNSRIKRKHRPEESYYCLTFEYSPQRRHSTIYFALNQPYPFSRLINLFNNIRKMSLPSSMYKIGYQRQMRCSKNHWIYTYLQVQISNPSQTQKIILVLARQHPGETVSSFVCEGLIDELLNLSPQSKYLLKRYTFVIIPMVNPDGVIYGHSRCNLAGLDINRQWGESALKELNPQTYCIWKYIRQLESNADIAFVLDLHGHSKKAGCFLYGCRLESSSETRLFASILARVEKSFVNASCRYGQQFDKQNTIRCQLFKQIQLNCFTLETSFYGWRNKTNFQSYNEVSLKEIGRSLIKGIFISFAPEDISFKLEGTSSNRIRLTMALLTEKFQDIQSASEQSESQPDADNLPEEEYNQAIGIPETQLCVPAFLVKSAQPRPKPSHPLKLNNLKRKRKISTIPSSVVDLEKVQQPSTQPAQQPRPASRIHKKSTDFMLIRKRNNLTMKKGIQNLRLTLIADTNSIERQMFTSLQIIRREKQLIVDDKKLQPLPVKDSFKKQSSSYINYKIYKRRLNQSLNSCQKHHRVNSAEQNSKMLRTIQPITPKKSERTRIGVYDFPIF